MSEVCHYRRCYHRWGHVGIMTEVGGARAHFVSSTEYIGNNLAGRDMRRPGRHDSVIIRFYQLMRSHDTPPHCNNGKWKVRTLMSIYCLLFYLLAVLFHHWNPVVSACSSKESCLRCPGKCELSICGHWQAAKKVKPGKTNKTIKCTLIWVGNGAANHLAKLSINSIRDGTTIVLNTYKVCVVLFDRVVK